MKTYTYSTIEEFEEAYQDSAVLAEHSREMVKAISEGFEKGTKEVEVFAIDIEHLNEFYVVKSKASEWEFALESCLRHLEKVGAVDDAIDTYELIKKIKNK